MWLLTKDHRQSVLKNKALPYSSLKAIRVFGLIAGAAALIFFGWRIAGVYTEVSQTYLQISMKSSADGTAQVYYDMGGGLSEADSATASVIGDRVYHDYRFRLPHRPVYGMRFDPLMSEGWVAIRQVRWLDGLGYPLGKMDLKHLLPLNNIASLTSTDQEVQVVTNQGIDDPQIGISLPEPLKVGKGFALWRHPAVMLRILIESAALFFFLALLLSVCFSWRRKIPFAVLLALIIIVGIETRYGIELPATASYHEVDKLLYHLQTEKNGQADYIVLGDSVGRQISTKAPYLQNNKYAVMATNQAITMTGQYFIAQRYLHYNKAPRGIILLTASTFGDLDRDLSDNYIQRTFTDFSEILEIFLLKRDPVFTAKMLAYRWLPSFKYRLSLQKRWAGYTNAESLTGVPYNNKNSGASGYSLLRLMKPYLEKENIPRHHFTALLKLLNERHIPLFFLVPAINDSDPELYREHENLSRKLFPELQKRYPNFHYEDVHFLQSRYYGDGMHFNEAGLKIEIQQLHWKIADIENHVSGEAGKGDTR